MMGKAELMDAIAGKNRGNWQLRDKQAILIAIAQWKTATRHLVRSRRCAIYSTAMATALHYEQEFVEH